MTLTIHYIAFSATAVTPLELDGQAGASIRGAVVGGLLDRFCANKAAPTCAGCPLARVCPVAALVAPMRENGESDGAQRPRPYVVRPPAGAARRVAPGEALGFGVGLFGPAAQLFPYVFMAAQAIERSGLGRRLAANGGRRGALRIEAISAVNPLSDARQTLYTHGSRLVESPGLPIAPADVAVYAESLPADRMTLCFQTPMRLIEGERLLKSAHLTRRYQRHSDLPEPTPLPDGAPHDEWELDAQGAMQVDGVGSVSLITIIDVVSRLKVESYPCLDTTNPPLAAYQHHVTASVSDHRPPAPDLL